MALPALSSSTAIPADWLPLSRVAEILGLGDRSARRVALAAAARGLARKGSLPEGGGSTWWLSRSVDPRLARVIGRETRDESDRRTLAELFPAHLLDRAYRKARWLHAWRAILDAPPSAQPSGRAAPGKPLLAGASQGQTARHAAEQIVREARQAEGPGFKISVRSLQLWWSAYNEVRPDGRIRGVEALVDRYVVPVTSSPVAGCPSEAGLPWPVASRSPAAIDYFYSLYHVTKGQSVAQCHESTTWRAAREGWSWPASYSATRRWLNEHDDLAISCLMREGADLWCRRHMRYTHMDYARLPVGGLYMADHTRCDFWVDAGTPARSRQIRPWLTAVMDIRSRCIVGWHLGPEAHQDAILSALRMAFRDWAVPVALKLDNGADFASKLITGLTKEQRRALDTKVAQREIRLREDLVVCDDVNRWGGITNELKIDLKFALPYCPWAKGPLERWFGTFHGYCRALFATYCGRSSADKPEDVEEIRFGRRVKRGVRVFDPSLIPTLDQARETIREIVLRYHHRAHRGQAMNGRAPLAVWSTAAALRRADDNALAVLMSIRGQYKVHAQGVTLRVGAGTVSYGAKAPCLKKMRGREVLVALDQAEVGHAWALDVKTRRILGRLDANDYIEPGVDVDHAREAMADTKREQAQAVKARRTQVQRTRTAAERLNREHRERVAELRATGTDTADVCSLIPVSTGFEGVSIPDSKAVPPPPRRSRFDNVDCSSLRLSDDRSHKGPGRFDDIDLSEVQL